MHTIGSTTTRERPANKQKKGREMNRFLGASEKMRGREFALVGEYFLCSYFTQDNLASFTSSTASSNVV